MRLTLRSWTMQLKAQEGFAMPAVLAGMLVVMMISVAAIGAASGDINLARTDQDDKQAYAAAEAGVNDYLGNLNTDTNYWAKCTNVGGASPINQKGVAAASRKWRDVPGSANSEYSLELIPAPGYSACLEGGESVESMVNEGNIKIRSTGRVKNSTDYRTVTATYRRAGFLDYLYYTKFENQDPANIQRTKWNGTTRPTDGNGNAITGPNLQQWAQDKCQRVWWGTQATQGTGRREMPSWRGQYQDSDGDWTPSRGENVDTNDICGEITFISGDKVNGPFHSNDNILISGTPSFGREGKNDRVEISGDAVRGSGSPNYYPELHKNAAELEPPTSNGSLEAVADQGYVFTGQTRIVLQGTNMTVTNPNVNGGAAKVMPLPPSGVIYVANGICPARYNPINWKAANAGCGDARVSGTYSKNLTIAAQNDLIVMDSIQRPDDTDFLLGLISEQFVRIWHPVDKDEDDGLYTSCDGVSSPRNVRIDAAILTLSGSFTVDNYWCDDNLGTLTVNGAIGQVHRGVVGTSGGNTGYIKSYNYNEDLKFRSPPYFLDPLQASWRILRQGEQSPPCVKTTTACPAGPS